MTKETHDPALAPANLESEQPLEKTAEKLEEQARDPSCTNEESDTDELFLYDECPIPVDELLKKPLLLSNESQGDFKEIYCNFEVPLGPRTQKDYWLVYCAAMHVTEVLRYHRLKTEYVKNMRRAALKKLLFEAERHPAVQAALDPYLDVIENVDRYFKDPAVQVPIHKALEQAGFGPDALDAEMMVAAMPQLANFERLQKLAEGKLYATFRELQKVFGDNLLRAKLVALGLTDPE
jgi:hypothetical protein